MKKVIIAMSLMVVFLVAGGGVVSMFFQKLLGGGIEQTYIYPIYGAIVVLTGVVVGATQVVLSELRELKALLKKNDEE